MKTLDGFFAFTLLGRDMDACTFLISTLEPIVTSTALDIPGVCGDWIWKNDSVDEELTFTIERHPGGYRISSHAVPPVPIAFSRIGSSKMRFLIQILGTNRQGAGNCYYYAYMELNAATLHLWNIDQDKFRSPKWISDHRLTEMYGRLYESAGCSKTVLLSGVNPTGLVQYITDNFRKLRDYSPVTYTMRPLGLSGPS